MQAYAAGNPSGQDEDAVLPHPKPQSHSASSSHLLQAGWWQVRPWVTCTLHPRPDQCWGEHCGAAGELSPCNCGVFAALPLCHGNACLAKHKRASQHILFRKGHRGVLVGSAECAALISTYL